MTAVHVIGAAGFAGAQLAAWVDAHPALELGMITARADAGRRLVEIAPEYRVERRLEPYDPEGVEAGDMAAVCYPHAEAAPLVADLLERGLRVVDVSADHRLRDPALYPVWYGFEHPRPDLLEEAVYGLPERYRDAIADARLVANPGCYPEAAILGLLPLVGEIADVVVDAKSGVSGAGRTPTEKVHFSRVTDSVVAYNVLRHRHTPEIAQELGTDVTFTPHLVPVDRGLLATCYARLPDGAPHPDDLRQRYADFYAGHPFVEVVEEPPGMRAVQRTNYAQVCPMVGAVEGRVLVLSVIDNLGKGAAGQALQNLNLMAGRPETEGLRLSAGAAPFMPVRRVDWLRVPAEFRPVPEGSVTTPSGFRAGTAVCGMKASGAVDVAVLVSDRPTSSALLDTVNAIPSAPVVHNRTLEPGGLRAVVVNAGNANAATGSPGLEDARRMGEVAARALGLAAGQVGVCSTGLVGERLDLTRILPAVERAAAEAAPDGGEGFAHAICTTDRRPKAGAFRLALGSGGEVTIGAAAKGAGMIRPDMATLLAYVTLDAAVAPADLAGLARAAVDRSFNRITVDGQMSPSDTLLVLANGAGPPLGGDDLAALEAALASVCRWLAVQVVKDGEGADHVVRVLVSEAADAGEAEAVARAVGESPLVKAAAFGRDPNWGRVSQAVGQALVGRPGPEPRLRVSFDGRPPSHPHVEEVLGREEYDLEVALGRGEATAELWSSDLTHAYVTLNAEYHT